MFETLIFISVWIDIIINLLILSKQFYDGFNLKGFSNGDHRKDGRNG